MWWRIALFGIAWMLASLAGIQMLGYFTGGALLLGGLIVVVEGIRPLKWIVVRSTQFIDLLLFGFGCVALLKAGPTIAMVLAIAGLGFSLVYAPIIRYHHFKRKQSNRGR